MNKIEGIQNTKLTKEQHLSSMSKCLEEIVCLKLQVDGYISDEWAVDGLKDCIKTVRMEIERLEELMNQTTGEEQ